MASIINNIISVVSLLFVDPKDLHITVGGRRRSLRRVWWAVMLATALTLAHISCAMAAPVQEEAAIYSVCIDEQGMGVAPPNARPAQARLLARRAAMLDAVRKGVTDVQGAQKGRIHTISSENWDGNTYTIVAVVQVF